MPVDPTPRPAHTRGRRVRPALRLIQLLILFLAALVMTAAADDGAIAVARFSAATAGAPLPVEWQPLAFPKIPRQTEYRLVSVGDSVVVRADSRGAASGLVRRLRVDLKQFPLLRWRWQVTNLIDQSDVRRKDGDDYPARLYITFEYDPERTSLSQRLQYRLGRLLFGDIPIAAISYIWETRTPVGAILPSAYTGRTQMIVVESGPEHVGQWVAEERDVFADYRRAFGAEPPAVNAVAIMTDTDNTGASATAFYGDIEFRARPH